MKTTFIRRLYKIPKTSSAEGMKKEIRWETWRGKIRTSTSLPARTRCYECKSAGGSRCQLPSWVEWRGSAPFHNPQPFSHGSSFQQQHFIFPFTFSMFTLFSTNMNVNIINCLILQTQSSRNISSRVTSCMLTMPQRCHYGEAKTFIRIGAIANYEYWSKREANTHPHTHTHSPVLHHSCARIWRSSLPSALTELKILLSSKAIFQSGTQGKNHNRWTADLNRKQLLAVG